jgi:cystathionine beta-synthase
MKDNGFLEAPGDPFGRIKDLMTSPQKLITAQMGETIDTVVDRLRKGGYSQLPVIRDNGHCVGMIHEVDLLSTLLEKRASMKDRIDDFVQPLQGVVSPESPIRRLTDIFNDGHVAVVLEDERPIGIITKIDVIDYLAKRA